MQLEIHGAHHRPAAEHHPEPARRHEGVARSGGRRGGRGGGEVEGQARREAACVADGEWRWVPAERASEPRDRGRTRIGAEHRPGEVGAAHVPTVDQHRPVGERRRPLEPVLGEDHRRAEVVVEAHEGGEHVVGALRVELRRGLVEDEGLGPGGERARDHAALALAARERRGIAVAEVGDAERVEHLLDATAHRLLGEAEVLEHEREVSLHVVDDELRLRVLGDEPHDVGQLTRVVGAGRTAEDLDLTPEAPTARVRDEPVDRAQERALARARRADHDEQLAGRDLEIDVRRARRASSPGTRTTPPGTRSRSCSPSATGGLIITGASSGSRANAGRTCSAGHARGLANHARLVSPAIEHVAIAAGARSVLAATHQSVMVMRRGR